MIGGAGGIGRAVCLKLAEKGFKLAIHYHSNRARAEVVKDQIIADGGDAIVVASDVTTMSEVENMVNRVYRKFGALTVLVNAASPAIPSIKFNDLHWDRIEEHLLVNIKGSFNLIKKVVPIMESQKYGKIINITTQAIEKPATEWLHYITAKSALHGFTKALAYELAPKGIRLNMVSPGMTNTDLIADVPERTRLLATSKTPLRRIAEPEDIAGAIVYLASTDSDFMAGETIRVNGGEVMI